MSVQYSLRFIWKDCIPMLKTFYLKFGYYLKNSIDFSIFFYYIHKSELKAVQFNVKMNLYRFKKGVK